MFETRRKMSTAWPHSILHVTVKRDMIIFINRICLETTLLLLYCYYHYFCVYVCHVFSIENIIYKSIVLSLTKSSAVAKRPDDAPCPCCHSVTQARSFEFIPLRWVRHMSVISDYYVSLPDIHQGRVADNYNINIKIKHKSKQFTKSKL